MDLILFSLFILFCLASSLIEISKRRSFILLDILLVISYILLIATRSIYGTPDTSYYVDDFGSLSTNYLYFPGNVNTTYQYEYGYTLVSQISKIVLGNNVRIFFSFLAFINLIIAYISFKHILENQNHSQESLLPNNDENNINLYYKKILFAPMFSLFVSYFGFMYSGIVLRQGLAFSIFLIASSLLLNRKYIWGLLLLIVLLYFHNMAIFSLLILLFIFTKFTFKKATYYTYLIFILCLYLTRFYNVIASTVSAFLLKKFSVGFVLISSNKVSTYLGNTSGKLTEYSFLVLFNFIFSYIAIKPKYCCYFGSF